MARCKACNGTGRMNAQGGAAYGSADDFMQCSRCHGFGFVDGPGPVRKGSRRSTTRTGRGNASGNGALGVIVALGLGYLGIKWFGQNQQSITNALWYYVLLPIAAVLAAVAAFFLLRFLWRCGRWTLDGLVRHAFNLMVLTYLGAIFWAIVLGVVATLAGPHRNGHSAG